MKKISTTFVLLFVFMSSLIDVAYARTRDERFPTMNPVFGYGGVPSSDIDLNGVWKVIFDADGDTYLTDGTDDRIQIVAGGAIVARVVPEGIDIHDNRWLKLGTSLDAGLSYNASVQTPNTVLFALPTTSRGLVFIEDGDESTDFTHAQQTNPTVFIQASDQTDITKWGSFAHDGSNFILNAGTGGVQFDVDADLNETAKLIFDADGDTYFIPIADDEFHLFSNAALRIKYTNGGQILSDNYVTWFGSSADASVFYGTAQTPDALVWGASTDSRNIIITEAADINTDFQHGLQSNPTLFLQSSNELSINQWGSLAHDGTDFVLDVGSGNLRMGDDIDLDTYALLLDDDIDTWLWSPTDDEIDVYTGGFLRVKFSDTGARHYDNISSFFGDSSDASLIYDTAQTTDSLVLGVGADNRSLIVMEQADVGTDMGHALQTNPTQFWHAADETDTAKWGSVAHDGSNFVLDAGTGGVQFDADADLNGVAKLIFDADGDTDMFATGDDVIAVTVGGTTRAQFKTSGVLVLSDKSFIMGGSSQSSIMYSTAQTPNSLVLGIPTTSRAMILMEQDDKGTDFAHAQQANPTTFWHAADETDITKWGSVAHDGSAFVINSGKGDTKLDDDVEITGALTIGAYTRHIDINASASALGPTAPVATSIGTFRCLQFINASAEIFIEFEVPSDWDGISDMTLNIHGFAESGDAIADTETVVWDSTYRSVTNGEAYDNGTAVTISPIYTQSGAGTDKGSFTSTITVDHDNGNQPLVADDFVGVQIDLDEGTSTYSGDPHLCRVEIEYTSIRPKRH